MIRASGILLAVIFAVLGFFHLYWAAGGRIGSGSAVPSVDGHRLFTPSPVGTILVAVALVAAMLVVLGRLGIWAGFLPTWIFYWGTLGISLLFFLRAIGDFHYGGFFKSVQNTDFARWDTLLFSTLCLFIAVVAFLLSWSEI
jgi:hypothetical protein